MLRPDPLRRLDPEVVSLLTDMNNELAQLSPDRPSRPSLLLNQLGHIAMEYLQTWGQIVYYLPPVPPET